MPALQARSVVSVVTPSRLTDRNFPNLAWSYLIDQFEDVVYPLLYQGP